MLEMTVNPRSPAALNGALKKIKEMISSGGVSKGTPIHLALEPGNYMESVKYNLPNPIVIESVPGTKAENCVIRANNCESFNRGVLNRGVFIIGPNATNVALKNFSIENSHEKSVTEGPMTPDAAEALSWNSTGGTLFCEGMRISGRQNTLFLRGFSWILNSRIAGDVNFIYGDADTAFFEGCEIYAREDNRGDFPAFAVNSQALAGKTGFVFSQCRFNGDPRKRPDAFICRTDGKGSEKSQRNWDNVALLNCMVSEIYSPELLWDDDMSLEAYPRGNPRSGVREYNTRTVLKNGRVEEADTTRRNVKSYTLTEDDYFQGYASRYLILHDTPFAAEELP